MSDSPIPDTQIAARPDKKYFGLPGNDWVKMLATAVIGIIIGAIAWPSITNWLTTRTHHLAVFAYPVVDVNETRTPRILCYSITNDGSQEAEDLQCAIQVDQGKVGRIKVEPTYFNATKTEGHGKAVIKLDTLNHGETLLIEMEVLDTAEHFRRPDIHVRAKGIADQIGKDRLEPQAPPQPQAAASNLLPVIFFTTLMLVLVLMGWGISHMFRSRVRQLSEYVKSVSEWERSAAEWGKSLKAKVEELQSQFDLLQRLQRKPVDADK